MLNNPTNFRPRPDLPLIVQTDASNGAIGASLSQLEGEEGFLVSACSRSLKSAELNYSTIRRELLAICFAVKKFKRFLSGRSFIIRSDHLPLKGLLAKPLSTIENDKQRDMVGELVEYNFTFEYIPGIQNLFPDYLSRNCWDEIYSYSDFKLTNEKEIMVFYRQEWKTFILPEKRRSFLVTLHSSDHHGYTKMMNNLPGHWPSIAEDIKQFLADCLCSLTKKNRRKIQNWGTIDSTVAEYCADLFTYGSKTYLTSLSLQRRTSILGFGS